METVNQGNTTATSTAPTSITLTVPEPEKTFTQSEVDSIVKDRLTRERAKFPDYDDLKAKAARLDELEEASKTELQKATDRAEKLQKELDGMRQAETVRSVREKVAEETGVPANLLTGETEEACKEQASAIKAYAQPKYPNVKDGGEPSKATGKKATRDQFAEWLNNE